MEKVAVNLKLDKNVAEMLEKVAGPRKKGEYVSKKLEPILKKELKKGEQNE